VKRKRKLRKNEKIFFTTKKTKKECTKKQDTKGFGLAPTSFFFFFFSLP
jgi:hypothetical protein